MKRIFSFLTLCCALVPAFASTVINVTAPASGASVVSPFTLSASSSACGSAATSAMGYSLDNSWSTTIVHAQSILGASITANIGTHVLHVKCWGPGGADAVNIPIAVVSPVPPLVIGSVTVSEPAVNDQVTSPFAVTANAATCANTPTQAMGYSLDSSPNTTILKGAQTVSAQVTAALGAHTLHVKAWGTGGAACVTDVPITVIVPVSAPVIPPGAAAVSSIQALTDWKLGNDTGVGTGTSSGAMSVVNSPSMSGSALRLDTVYTQYGGERYWVSFGDDTTSHNFVYDAWVYLDASVANISNLEMDMNQVLANGDTVIYGFQCDGYSHTWDYTANSGTPANWVDVWIHSAAPCDIHQWTQSAWHHVQVQYSRDDSGNVTYQSAWIDGVMETINATVPSSFTLYWQPVLLTNLQIDGVGAAGQSTVYLDNVTITRW